MKTNILAVHEPSLDYGGRLSALVTPQIAAIFDTYIYSMVDRYTEDYNGGTWDMVEFEVLPEEGNAEDEGMPRLTGFYLRLRGNKTFHVTNAENYWEGELSGEALSIFANTMAFSHLSFQFINAGDVLAPLYEAIRYYGYAHPEAAKLIGVLD